MQSNTERRKKKIAPVAAAILVSLYMLPVAAVAVLAMIDLTKVEGMLMPLLLFLLLYLVIGGAVIIGVLAAMKQRLREIDGGEEEDASQY